MAYITDTPTEVTDAGQEFNYPNPPAFATVVLINCPLDPDHRNAPLNAAAVDTFIAAQVAAGLAYTNDAINIQNPFHDLDLGMPYEDAVDFYNYGRLTIGTRSWYIFYTPEYLNKTTTRFVADIDEWPSYQWSLGYSMIERGHIAVAASTSDTYGNNYLTAPEPVDSPPVQGVLSANILAGSPANPDDWTVIVVSANNLNGNGTSTPYFQPHINSAAIGQTSANATAATNNSSGSPQVTVDGANYPWSVGDSTSGSGFDLYIPHVVAAPLSTIDGVPAGGGVYLFTMSGFAEYATIMQGAPWVMAGISDMKLVPSWAVGGGGSSGYTPETPPESPTGSAWNTAAGIPNFVGELTTETTSASVLSGWRTTALADMDQATWWLKLLTSPFTEIRVGNGDMMRVFKPEAWTTADLEFEAVTDAPHGGNELRLIPTNYNELGAQMGISILIGGSAGNAKAGYGSAASNPAGNDMGPYMGSFNAVAQFLQVQQQNALAETLARDGITLNLGTQGIQTVLGTATGAVAGGGVGAGLAAASGVSNMITSAIAGESSIVMLDVRQDGSFNIATQQLGYNGIQAMETFNAWNQALTSVSGSAGTHALASGWRAILETAFQAIIVMPTQERVNALTSMWTRYGYMIGQAFTPPQLNAMSSYTYWKTQDATVIGAMPQERRQTVAAAFDRGVTIWDDISLIGTQPENTPLTGISY